MANKTTTLYWVKYKEVTNEIVTLIIKQYVK